MPILRRKRAVITHNPFLDPIPDRPEIISNQRIGYTSSKGIDGNSNRAMDPPKLAEFRHPSIIINAYKAHIRRNLPNNIFELQLRNFLNDMENSTSIQNLYDIMGLIDDIFSIENQFTQVKVKAVFVPSIESLLHRIENFIEIHQIDDVHKYVLNLIYTAALSKLCAVVYLYVFRHAIIIAKRKSRSKRCEALLQPLTYLPPPSPSPSPLPPLYDHSYLWHSDSICVSHAIMFS